MKQKEPTFTLRDRLNELKDVYFSGYVSINQLCVMVNSTQQKVNQLINMNGVIKSNHKLIDWRQVMEDMEQPTVGDFNNLAEEQKEQYNKTELPYGLKDSGIK